MGMDSSLKSLRCRELGTELLDLVKKQHVEAEQSSSKLAESQNSVIELQQQLLVKQKEQISHIHAGVEPTLLLRRGLNRTAMQ